jgi:hypothetical protein
MLISRRRFAGETKEGDETMLSFSQKSSPPLREISSFVCLLHPRLQCIFYTRFSFFLIAKTKLFFQSFSLGFLNLRIASFFVLLQLVLVFVIGSLFFFCLSPFSVID